MKAAASWERHRLAWPHHEHSRFVEAGGLLWHVQRLGEGPCALLVHGTGSATHTWRDLMPLLAEGFEVVSLDLPGHGFTSAPDRKAMGLDAMAASVAALVKTLALEVRLVLGHSAGAAIAARMVLDGAIAPALFAAVNGAFFRFRGLTAVLFPTMARLLAATSVSAEFFARRDWDLPAIDRLMAGTGSHLDERGLSLYARLMREPGHAAGALRMMASWDLRHFEQDLARWHTPMQLIVGARDRAVEPAQARRLCAQLSPSVPCRIETIALAGHLAHEEQPGAVASCLRRAWAEHG